MSESLKFNKNGQWTLEKATLGTPEKWKQWQKEFEAEQKAKDKGTEEKKEEPSAPDPHAHIRDFLGNLSSGHSYHSLITPEEGGFSVLRPGDIATYSDHGDSHDPSHMGYSPRDAYDPKKWEQFEDHMNQHDEAIRKYMEDNGYELINENDGSGGGLHYGARLWGVKKKPKP